MALRADMMQRLLAVIVWSPPEWFDVFAQIGLVATALTHATPAQRERLRLAASREQGLLQRRKVRRTGSVVAIYDATALLETGEPDLRYSCVCETHGFCVGTRTRAEARGAATDPALWCEPCAALSP